MSSERIVLRGWYTPITAAAVFTTMGYVAYTLLLVAIAVITNFVATNNAFIAMVWAPPVVLMFIACLIASGTRGVELLPDEMIVHRWFRFLEPTRIPRSRVHEVVVWKQSYWARYSGEETLSFVIKQVFVKTSNGSVDSRRLCWVRRSNAVHAAKAIADWADVPWSDPEAAPMLSPHA